MRATELIARETRCGPRHQIRRRPSPFCQETQDSGQKRQVSSHQKEVDAASSSERESTEAKIWIGKNEGSGEFTKLLIMIKYEVDFLIIGAHWVGQSVTNQWQVSHERHRSEEVSHEI